MELPPELAHCHCCIFLSFSYFHRKGIWGCEVCERLIFFVSFGRVGLLKGCEFYKKSISSCES